MNCPACGSLNIKKSVEEDEFFFEHAATRKIPFVIYTCQDCESAGDFFGENEILIEQIFDEMRQECAKNIIQKFVDNKYYLIHLDAVLDLPQGTLQKWANGKMKPTNGEVTMLRYAHDNFL